MHILTDLHAVSVNDNRSNNLIVGDGFCIEKGIGRTCTELGTVNQTHNSVPRRFASADGALTCRGFDTAKRSLISNGGRASKGKQAQHQ